jgi:hypothetical protein
MSQATLKRVTITLDSDVHQKGKVLARADRRDFSSYVEWLIRRDADKAAEPTAGKTEEEVAS